MSFGHSLCQTSNLREYGPQIMFHKSHFLKLDFKLCAIFLLSTRTGQDINLSYVLRFWIQFDIIVLSWAWRLRQRFPQCICDGRRFNCPH